MAASREQGARSKQQCLPNCRRQPVVCPKVPAYFSAGAVKLLQSPLSIVAPPPSPHVAAAAAGVHCCCLRFVVPRICLTLAHCLPYSCACVCVCVCACLLCQYFLAWAFAFSHMTSKYGSSTKTKHNFVPESKSNPNSKSKSKWMSMSMLKFFLSASDSPTLRFCVFHHQLNHKTKFWSFFQLFPWKLRPLLSFTLSKAFRHETCTNICILI